MKIFQTFSDIKELRKNAAHLPEVLNTLLGRGEARIGQTTGIALVAMMIALDVIGGFFSIWFIGVVVNWFLAFICYAIAVVVLLHAKANPINLKSAGWLMITAIIEATPEIAVLPANTFWIVRQIAASRLDDALKVLDRIKREEANQEGDANESEEESEEESVVPFDSTRRRVQVLSKADEVGENDNNATSEDKEEPPLAA